VHTVQQLHHKPASSGRGRRKHSPTWLLIAYPWMGRHQPRRLGGHSAGRAGVCSARAWDGRARVREHARRAYCLVKRPLVLAPHLLLLLGGEVILLSKGSAHSSREGADAACQQPSSSTLATGQAATHTAASALMGVVGGNPR
jgi:hypothetical protein